MRNDSQATTQRNGYEPGRRDDDARSKTTQPRWDQPVDLPKQPPLDIATVDPLDWSHYVTSRMNAYERAW